MQRNIFIRACCDLFKDPHEGKIGLYRETAAVLRKQKKEKRGSCCSNSSAPVCSAAAVDHSARAHSS